MRSRFIVTGANGFIGAATVAHFRTNADVLAVDRSWTRSPGVAEPRTTADLTMPLPDAPELHDTTIIHAAGNVESCDRQDLWDVNVTASFNVFEWAVRHQTRHLVLLSTAEVYAPDAQGPITEDQRLNPASFVGHSKRLAEQIGAVYWREFQLPVTVLRLFFPFGPGQVHGRVPQLIAASRSGSRPPNPLASLERFSPVHLDDVVSAIEAISQVPEGYRVFNVCGDTIVDFARITGDGLNLIGDNSLLKSATGWKPTQGADALREQLSSS